jgi:hypothetical protein
MAESEEPVNSVKKLWWESTVCVFEKLSRNVKGNMWKMVTFKKAIIKYSFRRDTEAL